MFTINNLLPGRPVVTVGAMTALGAAWPLISAVVVVCPRTRGTVCCVLRPQHNHYLPNQQTHGLTCSFGERLLWEWFRHEGKGNTKLISICQFVLLQLLFVST